MEYTRYIGWDVHAATIAVAVAEEHAVRQWVQRQPDAPTLLVCYEAGPTGFEMA